MVVALMSGSASNQEKRFLLDLSGSSFKGKDTNATINDTRYSYRLKGFQMPLNFNYCCVILRNDSTLVSELQYISLAKLTQYKTSTNTGDTSSRTYLYRKRTLCFPLLFGGAQSKILTFGLTMRGTPIGRQSDNSTIVLRYTINSTNNKEGL
ncbi:MAG: hypothetical protein WDO15_18895 [Bacteroidota bacterium]